MSVKKEIILVDDNQEILEILEDLLEDYEQFHFRFFDNPQSCLEYISKENVIIHAVVVDYQLPGMTGQELGKSIRNILKEVPLFLASGSSIHELDIEEGFFKGHINKPYTPDVLINSLKDI